MFFISPKSSPQYIPTMGDSAAQVSPYYSHLDKIRKYYSAILIRVSKTKQNKGDPFWYASR